MVSEIAAASREQTSGIDQVNTAVTQVDQVTQGNAAQTEELSATALSLSEKSRHLQELVAGFELGDAKAAKVVVSSPPAPAIAPAIAPAPAPKRKAAGAPRAARAKVVAPASGVHRSVPPAAKAANGFEEF